MLCACNELLFWINWNKVIPIRLYKQEILITISIRRRVYCSSAHICFTACQKGHRVEWSWHLMSVKTAHPRLLVKQRLVGHSK